MFWTDLFAVQVGAGVGFRDGGTWYQEDKYDYANCDCNPWFSFAAALQVQYS
jgi:hypothetical protein